MCGTAFFGIVAYLLFKEIKEIAGIESAHFAAILFTVFRVKQSVFPEYANLQIAFSTLMFISLIRFFKDQSRISRLVMASLFLCLEVLSYPSCIVAVVATVALICLYSDRKVRNLLIFLGTSAVSGILYAMYFALRIGPKLFLECIRGMMNSDLHTNEAFVSGFGYYKGFVLSLIWIAAASAFTILARLVIKCLFKKKFNVYVAFGASLFAINAVMILFGQKKGIDWTCCFYIIPLMLIIFALFEYREANDDVKRFYLCGVVISGASALATAMLTNLGVITYLAYLVLGGAVSFAVIKDLRKKVLSGMTLILLTVLFNRGIVVWGYTNTTAGLLITDVENYVRNGPEKYLITDLRTCQMTRDNAVDFSTYILPDDKILIVEGWLFDPGTFMLLPGEISNFSVIDTPYYNEEVEHYFEINPDKIPTVVAVRCWFGNEEMNPDSYIMKWVGAYYEPIADGSYYRFYRKISQISTDAG